jgi:hypothetical protein
LGDGRLCGDAVGQLAHRRLSPHAVGLYTPPQQAATRGMVPDESLAPLMAEPSASFLANFIANSVA